MNLASFGRRLGGLSLGQIVGKLDLVKPELLEYRLQQMMNEWVELSGQRGMVTRKYLDRDRITTILPIDRLKHQLDGEQGFDGSVSLSPPLAEQPRSNLKLIDVAVRGDRPGRQLEFDLGGEFLLGRDNLLEIGVQASELGVRQDELIQQIAHGFGGLIPCSIDALFCHSFNV